MKSIISQKIKNLVDNPTRKNLLGYSFKKIRTISGINENIEKKMVGLQNVIGYKETSLGIVEINREHKNNILTMQFMDDLRRSLEAMEIDEYTKCIIMHPKNHEIFSLGSDLKTLYWAKKNNDDHLINQYFKKLYDFQNFVASYHKPLLTIGSGRASGSGATFLANSPYSFTFENSSFMYNETKYGYVPDGGSIYLLSRLEGEVGVYLALTGKKLNFGDMKKVGVSDGLIHDLDYLKKHISVNLGHRDISFSLYTSGPGFETFENKFRMIKERKFEENPYGINDIMTTNGKMKLDLLNKKFKDPYQYPWLRNKEEEGDLKTSPLTNIFNKEIFPEEDHELKLNSYKNSKRSYTNTYNNFERQILFSILENNHEINNIENCLKAINKYFRFNDVKEIMKCLKENSAFDIFAAECHETMNQRSLISMQVTLDLIRKAKDMNYEETQRMEMNAAKNLIKKSKDFDAYFEKGGKLSKEDFKNKKRIFAEEKDFSRDFIAEIIESPSGTENIELEIKRNSLLPNKTFRNTFPDVFRLWINEHPRANKTIREFFDYEIKHYMIEKLGIDLRDSRITIDEVRRVVSKIYSKEFSDSKTDEKVFNLIGDNTFIEEYLESRKNYCDKYLSNATNITKLKELINNKTNEIFEKSFKQTCKNILRKCKDIRDLDKRRTWQRLRKWIFANRIMTYKSKQKIIQSLRTQALGEKALYIPRDESVSWRDDINPDIKKSPFYQLAGLFKLKTISPEYALKFSVTDLNSQSLFECLEINEEKLVEIRNIIKENPKKLIEIFNSNLDKETQELFDSIEEKSLLEYDRLYRIRNDGKSPIDKMNFVDEFRFLKKKWMEFKNSVLSVMRNMILETIFKIVDNKILYGKNMIDHLKENNTPEKTKNADVNNALEDEDLEDFKYLFNILRRERENLESYDFNFEDSNNSLYEKTSKNLIESIKNSFMNNNEKLFSNIIQNLNNKENESVKKFSEKSFDLLKSITLHFLLKNTDKSRKEPIKIEDFNVEESLSKLFSYDNFLNSEKLSKTDTNKFLHYLFIKYGSINVFSEAIKNTKTSMIEILNQITNNEIVSHYENLLNKVPENNLNKVKTIFQKEKALFEDLLKEYYDMKLNLNKLEVIQIDNAENGSTNIPFQYKNIDYFISKLQDIAFSEFIIADRTDKCPIGIDSLIKTEYKEEENIQDKHKKLMELYVALRENFINPESKEALTTLTKSMQKTEWFSILSSYSKNIDKVEIGDILNGHSSKNLDKNVENFMKKKFNEYIYEDEKNYANHNTIVNTDFLELISEKRYKTEFVDKLITKYRLDKVKINEEIYDNGLNKNGKILANRNNLNQLKIMLTDKINELLKNYNINEITRKYIDYVYNPEIHIHRILCNITDKKTFFKVDELNLKELNTFVEYGNHLLQTRKLINYCRKTLIQNKKGIGKSRDVYTSEISRLEQLRNYSFNRRNYVKNLKNVKAFLEAREYFLNKIFNEFYPLFNYSKKYQINVMSTNIQADFAKLYNHLKDTYFKNNKKITMNFNEFIISDKEFSKNFKNINFDDFFGLDNINLIKKRIDEMNNLKIKEQDIFDENNIDFISEREFNNIIRNLVVEEISKTEKFDLSDEHKIDETIDRLIKKEIEINQNLKENGFYLKNEVKLDLDSKEKHDLINEYKLKFKNFSTNANNSYAQNLPLKNREENHLVNSLKNKIESRLFSLRQINNITNKSEAIEFDSPEIDLNKKTVEEYLKDSKEYGNKYNTAIKYLSGEKLSLRDMILNGFDKTMKEYNDHELTPVFTSKIPTDLIKTSLEVLDAKIIKAVKLLNTDIHLKNLGNKNNPVSDFLEKLADDSQDKEANYNFDDPNSDNLYVNPFLDYFTNEDFLYLEKYRNHLLNALEEPKNEKKLIEEGKTIEAVDENLKEKERAAEELELVQTTFNAIDRIYQLRKQKKKFFENTKNKSIYDLNIPESMREELINDAIQIQKEESEKTKNQESQDYDDIENTYQVNQEKKFYDPSKLTDKELKLIYSLKLKDLVDLPDFSSKYSLLKYVYDYYMGTLSVNFESHFEETEERIALVNEAVYLDRLEKTYNNFLNIPEFRKGAGILDSSYYDKLYDKNPLEIIDEKDNYKPFNFERTHPLKMNEETLFPYKEDKKLYDNLPDELEKQYMDNYRNLAFSLISETHPSRILLPTSERKYINVIRYEVNKYIENYYYGKLVKDGKKDLVYNKFSANLLSSTEKFRVEAAKYQKKNAEISAMQFNVYEGEVGYAKLLNEENLPKDSINVIEKQFDKFMEKMYSNYLQMRKDKINFTKEKLNEVKQNISHTSNLFTNKSHYELLKLSNQDYIEYKKLNDIENADLPNVPNTVNPDSPHKLDLESFLKANQITKEYPGFEDSDITEIFDLDNASSFANFGKYCSIPNWLVYEADKEKNKNYLEKYLDTSPEKFIEFAIEEIVEDYFLMRHQIERNLTREELKAFDLENIKYFSLENISFLLNVKLNELALNIHIAQDEGSSIANSSNNDYIQETKIDNQMYYVQQSIKDEDAFYRSVAYRMRMDKMKADKVAKHFKTSNSTSKKIPKTIKHSLQNMNSFEYWYYSDLQISKFRKNPESSRTLTELEKEQQKKLFSYINGNPQDYNYTSQEKLENAKFLIEFGENNTDKREKINRLKASTIIDELRKKSSNYSTSQELKEFFNDKI